MMFGLKYCTIFPGVKIGNNSIVSTYSIVTETIPANVQVAGQPARIIKSYKMSKIIEKKLENVFIKIFNLRSKITLIIISKI